MGRPNKWGFAYQGVYRTAAEWAGLLGLGKGAVNYRLRQGWTPEEIVKTPPGCPKYREADPCEGCGHWRVYDGVEARGCNYYLDTGELRSFPQKKCERRKEYVQGIHGKAAGL